MADPFVPPDPATTEWVPIWHPVSEGPVGPAGPQGPPGPSGLTTPHHLSHEPGGTDAIAALNASVLTAGIVADARLAANVARTNVANNFAVFQHLNNTGGDFPGLFLTDVTAPANQKTFRVLVYNQELLFWALDDAGGILGTVRIARNGAMTMAQLTVGGLIYERARAVPMGEWQPYTPTWTTDSATQPTLGDGTLVGRYTLIGKTCHFRAHLRLGSTTNKGTGTWGFSLPVLAATGPPSGLPRLGFPAWAVTFGGIPTGNLYPNLMGFLQSQSHFFLIVPGSTTLVNDTKPNVWAANDELIVNGTYEIA